MACSSKRMKIFTDYVGRKVRLTHEREAHILDHPEMVELIAEVGGYHCHARTGRTQRVRSDGRASLQISAGDKSRRQMAMRGGKV
jgi:hypothetical protein